MNEIDFLHNFPEIKEKNDKYYLFFGIVFGLSGSAVVKVVDLCLDREILKRKILLNKITSSAANWPININNALFDKLFLSLKTLGSYFKKESASMMLSALCPYVSTSRQKKLLLFFLKSKYKNNRKRAYVYLFDHWSQQYNKDIEVAWKTHRDEEIIRLLVNKMPREFLLRHFKEISDNFKEEDLYYDFHLKILRNQFYSRIVDDIPNELERLKDSDPISFIFIIKESGKKVDPKWAIEIYKKLPTSRKYLPKWYSEMRLWGEILKQNPRLFHSPKKDRK